MPNQEVVCRSAFDREWLKAFGAGKSFRWTMGKSDSASTKDLRLALRRYRSFFDRPLSI